MSPMFTVPNSICGKVIFLHLSPILYIRVGLCPPDRHPPGRHPPGRHPLPWADTLPRQTFPFGQTPHPETATTADGTHPTGMHSFLPPANVVCEGYVFTHVCHSVHRGGGVRVTWHTPPVAMHAPPGSHARPPRQPRTPPR